MLKNENSELRFQAPWWWGEENCYANKLENDAIVMDNEGEIRYQLLESVIAVSSRLVFFPFYLYLSVSSCRKYRIFAFCVSLVYLQFLIMRETEEEKKR